MSLLAGLTEAAGVEQERDVIGGGSFIVDSGADTYDIDLAYVGKSSGGATSVTVHLKSETAQLRHTFYVTNREGKTYSDKDGKKNNLPGFSVVNNLCLLTVGKTLAEMTTEEKVAKLYDYQAKKEVPTAINALTELHGQKIIAGVLKVIVDKTKDTGTVDALGKKIYEPTGETREENEIDKFFRARDGLTKTEIEGGVTEATFLNAWKEKWTGVTKNKAKGVSATGAVAGAPASVAAPTKSLFK